MIEEAGEGIHVADLADYRELVDDVHRHLCAADGPLTPADSEAVLRRRLVDPSARRVLDRVAGGVDGVIAQAREEVAGFVANPASNAKTSAVLVRIMLLQQIDLAWWASAPEFQTPQEIDRSSDLVDLVDLRREGALRFGFSVASDNMLRRARKFARTRALPAREPRAAGLSCTRARPGMVAVLNAIAVDVASGAPAGTPSMWVNSVMRSVQQQRRLRDLGYSALLPSAHCRGWAADIEMSWFARFGAAGVLRDVLLEARDKGTLNVIDEGQAWHVCPHPDHTLLLGGGIC